MKLLFVRLSFVLVVYLLTFISPSLVSAGAFSFLTNFFGDTTVKSTASNPNNSQNMALLQAAISPDPNFARGGGDIIIVNDTALLPDMGPIGTQVDVADEPIDNGQISIYVVRPGDSLGVIAKMYGVSINTIVWANDLKNGTITPGQKLIILPISGIQHTVKKNDTIKSIAKKYKSDAGEILAYNGLSATTDLEEGSVIIIPDGEGAPISLSPATRIRGSIGVPNYVGYYIRPVSYDDGHKTQGLHGYNGIDIGATIGVPVRAAAEGQVIIARFSGWNGGYGKYLVIVHPNGTQTLYGHLSSIGVNEGAHVSQGQIIGLVGNTGRSTGPHLHFEVRGAKNPF